MDPTAYDPPVELEGPNMGLVEQLAARLWRQRSSNSTGWDRKRERKWADQTPAVQNAWRETAHDALLMLMGMGMKGPVGEPRADRFEGLSYCWNYSASEWQVNDADGGYVALVRETPDLEIMLAAPGMRAAINGLLDALPENSPALATPEMMALAASLPEAQ